MSMSNSSRQVVIGTASSSTARDLSEAILIVSVSVDAKVLAIEVREGQVRSRIYSSATHSDHTREALEPLVALRGTVGQR